MKYFKKYEILLGIMLIMLDQIVKIGIDNILVFGESHDIFRFFSITKIYNYGISFSILNGSIWLIIIISILALVYLLKLKQEYLEKKIINLGMFLAFIGGIGNLIDRLYHGYVIDYFHFHTSIVNFPIFNIADIYVSLGFIIIIIGIIKREYEN